MKPIHGDFIVNKTGDVSRYTKYSNIQETIIYRNGIPMPVWDKEGV